MITLEKKIKTEVIKAFGITFEFVFCLYSNIRVKNSLVADSSSVAMLSKLWVSMIVPSRSNACSSKEKSESKIL